VDGTPAGVTLHHMDDGIDTGDIVAQERVTIDPADTGESLYHKLEKAGLKLLRDTWPLIESGKAPRQPQKGKGTHHRASDVDRIDEVNLDETYTGRQIIDLLRARTFAPHSGAYFKHRGRKIHLRIQLFEEGPSDEP
jgi:methionyl-tRNA formyltransferase